MEPHKAIIGWNGGVRVRTTDIPPNRRGNAIDRRHDLNYHSDEDDEDNDQGPVNIYPPSQLSMIASSLQRSLTAQTKMRRVLFNVSIIVTPVVVCILLFLLQLLANTAINSANDYYGKCGCKCISCCGYYYDNDKNTSNYACSSLSDDSEWYCRPSNFTECLQFDANSCGIEFSTADQAAFCKIDNPIAWPPLIQVPEENEIAARYAPNVPILYTGNDRARADAMANNILRIDNSAIGSILLNSNNQGLNSNTNSNLTLEDVAEFLLDNFEATELSYGTAEDVSYSLYLEPAFMPSSTSSSLTTSNLQEETQAVEDTTTVLYFLLPDCNAVPSVLLEAVDTFSIDASGISLQCRNTPLLWRNSSRSIDAEIYCSDPGSDCVAINGDIISTNDISEQIIINEFSTLAISNEESGIGLSYSDSSNTAAEASPTRSDQVLVLGPTEAFNSIIYDFGNTAAVTGGIFDVNLWYYDKNYENVVEDPPVINRLNLAVNRASQSYLTLIANAFSLDNANDYAVTLRGLKGMPKPETRLSLDFSTLLGPLFYLWLLQALLPLQTKTFVQERELGYRSMMRIHGLSETAYWCSSLLGHLVLYFAFAASFISIGYTIGLLFFTANEIVIQIILYVLWGCTEVAFAAFLSTVFMRSHSAMIAVTMWVFISGLFASVYIQNLLDTGSEWIMWLQVIPSFALFRGLYELSQYAFLAGRNGDSNGMSFDDLYNEDNGMITAWVMLSVEAVVFLTLAALTEHFFINGRQIQWLRCFRNRRSSKDARMTGQAGNQTDIHVKKSLRAHGDLTADVAMERDHAAQCAAKVVCSKLPGRTLPVLIAHKLRKEFHGGKIACSDLSLTVSAGECFGMLGPNGAGKSTTIGMLTGQLRPSSGSCFINQTKIWCDDTILEDDNLNPIARRNSGAPGKPLNPELRGKHKGPIIGVCPQFDRLWPQLTAEEHLIYYGRVKGIHPAEIITVIAHLLHSLNLNHSGIPLRPVHTYSGGMKRRLSVAIALLGDPSMVFLDEPSTGLDPGSRRSLWNAILEATNSRGITIMLTTHSMEEAEALCDRIGIFSEGSLQCIGSPYELTTRYGRFQTLSFTTVDGDSGESVEEFVKDVLGEKAIKKYELAGTYRYEAPTDDVKLARVFRILEAHRLGNDKKKHNTERFVEPQILEWEISSTSLEDVFHTVTTGNQLDRHSSNVSTFSNTTATTRRELASDHTISTRLSTRSTLTL